MSTAKKGNKVKVHYKGYFEDGTIFDSSENKDPLEFTLGKNMVISGFEDAVVGLDEGQSTTVTLEPENAYGQYRDDLIVSVNKSQFPQDTDPELGMQVQVQTQDGHVHHFTIKDIQDDDVTLDGNHPLAGETLKFDLELVEIVD